MAQNPLLALNELGQSVWLDNLSRELLKTGGLKKLIEEDGVSGVTSNPAIFDSAIRGSDLYDDQLRSLDDGVDAKTAYEALAITDIQNAADVLRPVYDDTNGTDGYVSLEVSPHLARDTGGTLAEAKRLWAAVDRPNLMIKIPGTEEGIPAIRDALTAGINVNITLLFSLEAYAAVKEAHVQAMEARLAAGEPLSVVASVASFFLSRIDVMVDKMLEADGTPEAKALLGRAAIASARLAYKQWREVYSGSRWEALAQAGARVQKPLWASTSTKNPDYPDVMYVEPLIGPETINTMPDATIEAFRDHGKAAATVEDNLEDEAQVLERLEGLGISIKAVTDALVDEGIEKFNKPFDALLESLQNKQAELTAG